MAARFRSARARRSRESKQAQKIRSEFYRSIWRAAADKTGASLRELDDETFEIARGETRIRVRQNQTPLDDFITVRIANNKPLCHRLLAEAGLPIPRYSVFDFPDLGPAVRFLQTAANGCVVKPACDTGGGIGVTTRVKSVRHLAKAAAAAAVYGNRLMIEDQIAGDNYRLLYLDGRLLDAVKRSPPSVVGDGRSTVAELIERTNAGRLTRGAAACQSVLNADLDVEFTLAAHGLDLSSRPAFGRTIPLKSVVNDNAGDDNVTAVDRLCPSLIEAGARAAKTIGIRLAGVDIITTDPSVPLAESHGIVLEVNTSPGHHWHYHKHDGTFRVADHILQAVMVPPQPASSIMPAESKSKPKALPSWPQSPKMSLS